jgi:hypothetical protein
LATRFSEGTKGGYGELELAELGPTFDFVQAQMPSLQLCPIQSGRGALI